MQARGGNGASSLGRGHGRPGIVWVFHSGKGFLLQDSEPPCHLRSLFLPHFLPHFLSASSWLCRGLHNSNLRGFQKLSLVPCCVLFLSHSL